MSYGYFYIAACVVIVAIGTFVIFQQESKQSEQSNSIPNVNTLQNSNGTNRPAVGKIVTRAGCELLESCFTTRFALDQITMTRGSSADVTVYLIYKNVPGTPKQLIVNMVPDYGSSTILNIWAKVPDETVANWIDEYEQNGTSPPGLYNLGQLESYPNPGPIVVNANETKSVIMRITLPPNLPDDFLNRGFILDAMTNTTYPHISGTSGGISVKVVGK